MDDKSKNNIAYNSHIEIFTTDEGRKFIEKTFRLSLGRTEAEELRQQVTLQRHAFEQMRIPVSELVDLDLVPTEGAYILKIREVFAGLDFMDVVDNDNFRMYLPKLLNDVFKPLLMSTKNELLPAGIDAILRNFVYDNKRAEFCYVDFIPPKVYFKGRYVQEIPEISDETFYNMRLLTHNNRAGIIYTLYINLVREFPTQLTYTAATLEQFLTDIDEPSLYKYIEESPMYRAHDAEEVAKMIAKIAEITPTNYLLLREIANWLNSQSPELEEVKKSVFKLTSQERDTNSPDYGKMPSGNLERARELLLSGTKKIASSM